MVDEYNRKSVSLNDIAVLIQNLIDNKGQSIDPELINKYKVQLSQ